MHLAPKHLVSIHTQSQFVKRFFKYFLSNCTVDAAVVRKTDYKTVGEADNLYAGVAEALLDAVLVGTVGGGDTWKLWCREGYIRKSANSN